MNTAFDMRALVAGLERAGRLETVRRKTDRFLKAGALIRQAEPRPVLLKDVAGWRVLANIMPDRDALARLLGVAPERFLPELGRRLAGKAAGPKPGGKVYGEVEVPRKDWGRLPFLTYYKGDGGPYLTAGVWIVRDPELHREVCDTIVAWLGEQPGWQVLGLADSPIEGADGNREFLVGGLYQP